MLPREYGYEIGQALEEFDFGRARTLLDDAVAGLADLRTRRDYREPLGDICTDARILNLFEDCGAITVEGFYRANPRSFIAEADRQFAPKTQIAKQSEIIENRYGPRLHGNFNPHITKMLLGADILNIYDCKTMDGDKIKRALGHDPRRIREVVIKLREFE